MCCGREVWTLRGEMGADRQAALLAQDALKLDIFEQPTSMIMPLRTRSVLYPRALTYPERALTYPERALTYPERALP